MLDVSAGPEPAQGGRSVKNKANRIDKGNLGDVV